MRQLLLILLFLPTFATGQSKFPLYKNTIRVGDSISQEVLFLRAEKWFADNDGIAFLTLDSVDKNAGLFFGTADFDCSSTASSRCRYHEILQIEVSIQKDNYSYRIGYGREIIYCRAGIKTPIASAEIARLPIIRYGDTSDNTSVIPTGTKVKLRRPLLPTEYKNYTYKECADEVAQSLRKAMSGI